MLRSAYLLILGGQKVPHDRVRFDAVDEDGQRPQAVRFEGPDQAGDVLLVGDHVLAVQQNSHCGGATWQRRGAPVPGEIVGGALEVAVCKGDSTQSGPLST